MTEDFGKRLLRLRNVRYGNLFLRAICPECGEPVDPDDSIIIDQPNATCPEHGRVKMPLAGVASDRRG